MTKDSATLHESSLTKHQRVVKHNVGESSVDKQFITSPHNVSRNNRTMMHYGDAWNKGQHFATRPANGKWLEMAMLFLDNLDIDRRDMSTKQSGDNDRRSF
jgi:hypothetical protein